jgi:hypothetical protein
MLTQPAPGLYFEIAPPPPDVAPLRSDIAGFIGPTRRGPVDEVVRVEEWREFERIFGGLDRASTTSYSVRSYFENGGETAYVLRIAAGAQAGGATWPPAGPVDAIRNPPIPGHLVKSASGVVQSAAFLSNDSAVSELTITAATPGAWANGAHISIEYRRQGSVGDPEVDIVTRVAGEPTETLRALPARAAGIPPAPSGEQKIDLTRLVDLVNQRSRFIKLAVRADKLLVPRATPGPSRLTWTITLSGGFDARPGLAEYLRAVDAMSREPAVAILAIPDLYTDVPFNFDASAPAVAQGSLSVLRQALTAADALHDRMVLIDLPADAATETVPLTTDRIVNAVKALREAFEAHELRAGAVYHPPVRIPDPLGDAVAPQRLLPASGPVAGLISRLDRERGPHHTPANAVLYDAVDVLQSFDRVDQGRLADAGVNVIRCVPARGLTVWGGRTLDLNGAGRFVAHRRLTHRLVRAIQRVAQPLVFEVNGPEVWLALVRAITSVLLEAWRRGALKGSRPEQAFRVKCDAETNPPEERDLGRVLCLVEFAPAVPMEFITLRVALGREGNLEVFER